MCNVRDGVGEGVGNWFEDNIRRIIGDGMDTFFGMISGFDIFL